MKKVSILNSRLMVLALSVSFLSFGGNSSIALSSSPTPTPKDAPKEAAKDAPKEVAKDAPKEVAKDAPKEEAKDAPKDAAKDAPKEGAKDASKTEDADKIACDSRPVFDISKGFCTIAEKAVLSVVNVSTTQIIEGGGRHGPKEGFPQFAPGSPFEDLFKEFFDQMDRPRKVQSLGSGFIIKSDDSSAFIVTNLHVIADAKKISILLNDGTELDATVHSLDERTDIAILKVKTDSLPTALRKLPAVEWGDSHASKVGDWVLAIGNPFGLGSTVTSGIISNRSRDIMMGRGGPGKTRVSDYVDDFIQHDAAINMGNSGGPLFNLEGKVIAINTAIYSPSGGSVGIGFAIPAAVAQKTVMQLLEFGRTKYGWLGVRIQPLSDDMAESLGLGKSRGAIATSITADGPAAKAKLMQGDVILEFDGKPVTDKHKLPRMVSDTAVGKAVKMKVWRNGSEVTLDLIVGEYPVTQETETHPAAEKPAKSAVQESVKVLGIKLKELSELNDEDKTRYGITKDAKGIVVLSVDMNMMENIKLAPGDVIQKLSLGSVTHTVTKPQEFKQWIDEAQKNKKPGHALLLVSRRGEDVFVPVPLEDEDAKEDGDAKGKDKEKDADEAPGAKSKKGG